MRSDGIERAPQGDRSALLEADVDHLRRHVFTVDEELVQFDHDRSTLLARGDPGSRIARYGVEQPHIGPRRDEGR